MSDATSAKSIGRLIGLVLLLAIVAGGYLAMRYFRKPPTQPSPDVGRAVAEEFLTTVRGGNAGKAWDASTAEFKSIEGRESFIRKSKATPLLKEPLQFNSSQEVMVQDQPRTEYLFQSSKAKMVRVLVGYEQGSWKVDRLAL
jgi:hypothetical protein